jgi:hypothetical protein
VRTNGKVREGGGGRRGADSFLAPRQRGEMWRGAGAQLKHVVEEEAGPVQWGRGAMW